MGGRTDGRIADGWMDRQMDRQIDGLTDGRMVRWMVR
jgi:hypothetical protein